MKKTTLRNSITFMLVISLCVFFALSVSANDTLSDITSSQGETANLLSESVTQYGIDENNLTSTGSLEQAFANVPTGGYIRLVEDVEISEPIVVTYNNFTFDLNGHIVYYTGTESACIVADEGSSITFTDITNADFDMYEGAIISGSAPALEVRDSGEMFFASGRFVSNELHPALNIAEGASVTITGGQFEALGEGGCIICNKGELVLDGGLVWAAYVPVCIENHGHVEFYQSDIRENENTVSFDFKDGTIDFSNADMTDVIGITILSELDETEIEEKITLADGTVLEASDSDSGNIYTVKSIYVASTDTEYFTTIEDAIEYAGETGEVIVLNNDIEGFEVGATDERIIISLNGCDIKGDDYAITVNDGAQLYIYNTPESISTISASKAIVRMNGGEIIFGDGFMTYIGEDSFENCIFEYHGGKIASSSFSRPCKILNKAGTVNAQDILLFESDKIFNFDLSDFSIESFVDTLEQDSEYYLTIGAPSLVESSVERDETTATVSLEVNYSFYSDMTRYYYAAVEKGAPAPTAEELMAGEAHLFDDYIFDVVIEDIEENDELDFYFLTVFDNFYFDDMTFAGNVNKIEIGKNVQKYPLWIGGVRVDENNRDDVMGDGAVSYDPETATLTLDGYVYDGADYYTYENESGEYGAIIYATQDLTINIKGENILEAADEIAEGIVVRNLEENESTTLNITGDGSLTVDTLSRDAFYIECTEIDMTIGEDVTLILRPDNEEGIYLDSVTASLTVKDNAVIDVENEEECIYFSCNCDYTDDVCECDHTMLVTDNAFLKLENSDEEGIYMADEESTLTVEGNARLEIIVDENAIDVGSLYIDGGYIIAITEDETGYSSISLNNEMIMTEGALIVESTISPAISAPYIKVSGGEVMLSSIQSALDSRTEGGIDTSDYNKPHNISAKIGEADPYVTFDPENAYDYSVIIIMPDGHYIITFDANDGETDTNMMYTYGGKLDKLPTATRNGYTFLGWFANGDDGEYEVTVDTVFSENTEVYAKWKSSAPISTGATVGSVTNNTRNPDGSTTSSKYSIKDGTTTDTTKHTDGSVTVTVTEKNGSSVTTHTDKDGTVTVTEKDTDGDVYTEIKGTNGATVVINRPHEGDITIRVKTDKEAEVFIPVVGAQSVTKVILKNEKGESVEVSDIETNEKGVKLTVTENALVTFVTEKSEDTDNETNFDDIENHWANEAIEYVVKAAIMNGVDEAEFAPDENVTRAMLVTVLYRLEGEPATNRSIPFADVDMGAYYANAVSWAKQNGIVNGTSYTEFSPDDFVLREQIAAILHRYAVYKGYDVSVGENTNILSYEDVGEVSEYAIAPMQYVIGSGIINGKTESTIAPQEFATRAEIATILHRFMETNK